MNQIPVRSPAPEIAASPAAAVTPSTDERFMSVALAEGRKALPACLPNPPVGCVLVRNDAIVATGFTQPPWQPHAEAMALAALAGSARDVTAYVTLEPCAFQGRTPSCARALVARGVGRVVAAVLDPDPRNNGAGIAILRDAGIEVVVGVGAAQALADLGPYLMRAAAAAYQPSPTCIGR